MQALELSNENSNSPILKIHVISSYLFYSYFRIQPFLRYKHFECFFFVYRQAESGQKPTMHFALTNDLEYSLYEP